jgi:hypothetical protein
MKKQFFLSLTLSSCLFADTFINPLPNSVKSIDNGGVKSAIDAYKDGIGAELMDKPGVATDNSAMNTLVYKYGEEAKTNNVTIVDQVINGNSNPTAADVVLAGRLTIDGASCNDSNPNSYGETWLSGMCQGGIINGTTCNDGNAVTTNDAYSNGVCIGSYNATEKIINVQAAGYLSGSAPFYKNRGVSYGSFGRSWTVLKLTNTYDFIESRTFDVYGSTLNADAMATYLNGLAIGQMVAVITYDEPQLNQTAAFRTALAQFPTTATLISGVQHRGAYAFLGVKGGLSYGECQNGTNLTCNFTKQTGIFECLSGGVLTGTSCIVTKP